MIPYYIYKKHISVYSSVNHLIVRSLIRSWGKTRHQEETIKEKNMA